MSRHTQHQENSGAWNLEDPADRKRPRGAPSESMIKNINIIVPFLSACKWVGRGSTCKENENRGCLDSEAETCTPPTKRNVSG